MMKGPFGEMIVKNSVNMMYGDLLKEMKLEPQEREQLNKILVEDQLAMMRSTGDKGTKDPKQVAAEYAERQKVTDAKIKQLLGDDRMAEYKKYQGQMGERMTVKQFEGQLAMTQTPLANEQKTQLIQIMSEEREKYTAENSGKTPGAKMDVMAYQEAINQRVSNRAGTVLSPEQLKEFSKWQQSLAQMMGQVSKSTEEAKTEGN